MVLDPSREQHDFLGADLRETAELIIVSEPE
jgi:hypothetical protein